MSFLCSNNQLYVKGKKCEFHVTKTTFLGYIIGQEGVAMDRDKVNAVTSWPTPVNIKDVQRFIWFANFYRRFIQGFSTIAPPLTALLKNKP